MSTTYAYNVGLGLNFSGQEGEQLDVEMNAYPQDSSYTSYTQGTLARRHIAYILDYTSSPMMNSSPNGHFFVPRISRSEGNPVRVLSLECLTCRLHRPQCKAMPRSCLLE